MAKTLQILFLVGTTLLAMTEAKADYYYYDGYSRPGPVGRAAADVGEGVADIGAGVGRAISDIL